MKLIIIGNGSEAQDTVVLAWHLGYDVVATLGHDQIELLELGGYDQAVIAVGTIAEKKQFWAEIKPELRCKIEWATLISEFAFVHKNAIVLPGSVVHDNCTVDNGATIAPQCYLSKNVTVCENAMIGLFGQLGAGCILGENVVVGSHTSIDANVKIEN